MRRVVISGYSPVQILDVTGPLEVFASAPAYKIEIAAPGRSRVLETSRGVHLGAALPIEEVSGPIDTLVIAGGAGAERGEYDEAYLQWISAASAGSRRIAGICTGAFILAAAGILNGKHAVTHWKFCDRLAREFPNVQVNPDAIYLRDGSIYTSAGITAGIDLSLALVEEDHGHNIALSIARQLVMFLVRPGGQAQYSHMLSSQAITSDPMRELQVWMRENLKEDLRVERLAHRMRMSTRHFSRVCHLETNMNPGQLVERMRVEAAQQMIDGSVMGLKEIAAACGFGSADSMRRSFLRILGVTAGNYMDRFQRRDR